jgi:glycerol-3-phosphate acyltransferase PlsY
MGELKTSRENLMILALSAIILSYLVGAIPVGLIVGKLFKGVDIREHGSGNIGFTNALRVLGFVPGIIVLLLDVAKGVIPVLFISRLGTIQANALAPYMSELCGGIAIVGHIWTVFLKFHGGKGVSTSLGVFISVYPFAGLISLGLWLIVVAVTRYVSLGSILLCISFCVVVFVTYGPRFWSMGIMGLVITALVIYRHRGNIQRLLTGNERKFGHSERA